VSKPFARSAVMESLMFRYRNHKGEVSVRHVIPKSIRYGVHALHPGVDQWLLEAFDMDRKEDRTFSFLNILDWGPEE
jgi:predicted DNA-binding transcriptional regulator YafY